MNKKKVTKPFKKERESEWNSLPYITLKDVADNDFRSSVEIFRSYIGNV